MAYNRVIYIITLAGVIAFSIFYWAWFSSYVLMAILLLPALDLIVSLPGVLSGQIDYSLPLSAEQNGSCEMVFTVTGKKFFPTGGVKFRADIESEWAKSGTRFRGNQERASIGISTEYAGLVRCEVRRVWHVSLLGFFAFPKSVKSRKIKRVLILPAPVKPLHVPALRRNDTLRPKPGGGFAEDHDIRPYIPGDPVNAVHWKLTAKHDELMIREPLTPPEDFRLILCDQWETANQQALILGRLLWMSNHLLSMDFTHYVRLHDAPAVEITSSQELTAYLYSSLSGERLNVKTPPSGFTWVYRVDGKEAS